jgi:hypothetical protein
MMNGPIRWTDPTTWPWIIYLWLALLVGGWLLSSRRWLKRRRAAGWPIADGRFESTEVTKPNFSFTTKRGYYVAQLGYSYSVAGSTYSGLYKREFPTQPAADDFVRDLKGTAVAVRYSPSKSSRSMMLEPDIEAVLQNRPPSSDDESVTRTAIPEWLRPFVWVFVWLSAIGLLVSLTSPTAGVEQPRHGVLWQLDARWQVLCFPSLTEAAEPTFGRFARRTAGAEGSVTSLYS